MCMQHPQRSEETFGPSENGVIMVVTRHEGAGSSARADSVFTTKPSLLFTSMLLNHCLEFIPLYQEK